MAEGGFYWVGNIKWTPYCPSVSHKKNFLGQRKKFGWTQKKLSCSQKKKNLVGHRMKKLSGSQKEKLGGVQRMDVAPWSYTWTDEYLRDSKINMNSTEAKVPLTN